jgi:hypothetical protein
MAAHGQADIRHVEPRRRSAVGLRAGQVRALACRRRPDWRAPGCRRGRERQLRRAASASRPTSTPAVATLRVVVIGCMATCDYYGLLVVRDGQLGECLGIYCFAELRRGDLGQILTWNHRTRGVQHRPADPEVGRDPEAQVLLNAPQSDSAQLPDEESPSRWPGRKKARDPPDEPQ